MLLEGSATEEQYTQLLHLVQEQLASTKGNFSTVLKTLSADVEKVGLCADADLYCDHTAS